MRKTLALAVLAAVAGTTHPLQAQDAPKCNFLCAPVFVAQPGLLVTNTINKPEGASTSTHFLARFTTVIPTTIPRTALVALIQWTPWNKSNPTPTTEFNNNAPAFVFGPVVSLFDAGPLNFSIDGLGVYGPGGEESAYRTDFATEGIVSLSLGKMMKMRSAYMNGVAINGLFSVGLTHLPEDADGNKQIRPNLLFLLTLPIAPLP